MARRADDLTPAGRAAMTALANELRDRKAQGWSVVVGQKEIVLRPGGRPSGKFGITLRDDVDYRIAFFDQRQGYWTTEHVVAVGAGAAAELLAWAEGIVREFQ